MNQPLRALIVEDCEDDAVLIIRQLRRGGYAVVHERVDSQTSMAAALQNHTWDIVIADYNLPYFSAPDALQLLQACQLDLPFIIVSGSIGEDIAVAAMKAGAHDYLMKDNLARLVPAVNRELREAQERSQRRKAEQALRENEERFRSLIENALDVITVVAADGTIHYESPAAARVLGYQPEALMGQKIFDYLHPEDIPKVETIFQHAIQHPGEAVSVEFRAQHQNGSWLTLEAVGKQFLDRTGTSSLVVNSRDITERKQAEEVRKALAREKELHDLKSRFVSTVSHEFRTPLTVIVLSVRLLERFSQMANEAKKQQYIDRIRSAAKRMAHLLDDVLFLGKAEVDRLEFKPSPLELVRFCRDLVEEMQLIVTTQHTIVFICPHPTLPACMDEMLLRHIFNNLIANAIKYSPDQETVWLELVCEGDRAVFRVQDQGIGIPKADQKRLFESFHRGSNVDGIPGTGLGLSIVKQSVDLHGGKIEVKTTLGKGTTFTVRLPLYSEPIAPTEVE
jgi:PAS domain S-box-containing protein